MRRIALVLVPLLALLGLAAAPFVAAFRGLHPLVDRVEPAPGVRTVKDGYVAAFIVDVAPGAVVIVDCTEDADKRPVHKALADRGLPPEAVLAVFLTHGHPDHVGGCAAFPKAPVYVMAPEVPVLKGEASTRGPLPRLMGKTAYATGPVQALTDGQVVRVGSLEVTAFAVPGHTAGSAAFLTRDVLFLGDNATVQEDGRLRGAPWVFSDDTDENVASLKALAAKVRPLGVKALAPSHSGWGPVSALLDFEG